MLEAGEAYVKRYQAASGALSRQAYAAYCSLDRASEYLARDSSIGVWRSRLARSVRDAEVGGSSPLTPTRMAPTFQVGPDAQES